MKNFLLFAFFFAFFSGMYSCTKDTAINQTLPTCDSTVVNFTRDVQPIFVANCAISGCHDATTRQNGIDLSQYNDAKTSVGNSGSKSSICRMQGSTCGAIMPSGSRGLPTATIQVIINWRDQGYCYNVK